MNQPKNFIQKKFITNIFGDSYLSYINGKKFEEIAYSTYFDIDILPQLSKEFTFYIFIGTDSGMLLKHLQRLNIDPDSIYLFIEDAKIIQQLNKDVLDIKLTNILISTIDKWQEQAKSAGIIKYIEVDRVQTIKSFSALEQTYSPYTDIAQKLHNEINQLKWIHPDKFQKKIFIQRQIENCADNYKPAIQLKDLLKGKPALILAGGPSLDHYIDWIEEHQQHYVVIAVSRIARRLLSTKIIPDIFVTADPFESAYTTSKEVLAFGKQSILVSQSYGHPRLIGQWQGEQFYLGKLFPWDNDLEPENIAGVGPTVTNCAMHLAIKMGIGDQILFGVDLCYSKEGYSHVSQTVEYDRGIELGFTGTQITTNNNKKANTTYEWFAAQNTISVLAKLIEHNNYKVINPNPDAAKIDHVSHVPLTEIKIPTNTLLPVVEDENISHFTKEQRLQHYSTTEKEIKQQLKETQDVLFKTKQIVELCEKFSDIDNADTSINELISQLKKNKTAIQFIEYMGVNGFIDFIHPDQFQSPSDQSGEEFHQLNIERYYTSLYIASDILSEELKSCIQRLNIRIEEDSCSHSTDNIIEQWNAEHDQQYGRMLLVEKRNPDLYKQINKATQEEYSQYFEQQYKTKNKETVTTPLDNSIILLNDTEKKLYDYFIKNDNNNLSHTIKQLEQTEDQESISLTHLAQGYLYELEGKIDEAINEYLQADSEQTLESGLKRILDITLKNGDIENTVAVLNALSDISDDYLIQLAHLYQISEQYKDALDVYSLYIDKHPDDILILIKMGVLYLSLDILDGAEFVFKHILEIDVYNQTALGYLKQIKPKSDHYILSFNNIVIENNYNLIGIKEYNFYKLLDNSNLDIDRLKIAEKRNTVGFIATNDNISNSEFIKLINSLHYQLPNTHFTIFYFNKKIKNKIAKLITVNNSYIEYISPSTIYELTESVEVYIDVNTTNPIKTTQFWITTYEKLNNILKKHCKQIYICHLYDEYIKETILTGSTRISKITNLKDNYKQYQFTLKELKKNNYLFYNTLFYKMLHHQNMTTFSYTADDSAYIKCIELALKQKKFIHYLFEIS